MKFRHLTSSAAVAIATLLSSLAPASAQSILKTAGNYSALASQGITVAGAGFTLKNGNVGLFPAATTNITGFPPGTVSGTTLLGTAAAIISTGGANQQAEADLQVAATGLAAMAQTANYSNVDMANLGPLPPGVYRWNAAATLTGALILDAQGKNNVAWVFQFGTGLTTALNSSVKIINAGSNGGSDDGIFWNAATGAIVIGDNNTILGNYIAYTSISFTGSTQLLGNGGARFLALNAAITFAGLGTVNPTGGPGGGDMTGGLVLSGSSVVLSPVAPVTPPAGSPVITSSSTTSGTAGANFTAFTIAATGSPTSYGATGLPPGLTLNSTTGVISGAPTAGGVYSVTVTATNASGTSTATTLTITVASVTPPAGSPVVTSSSTTSGTAGANFTAFTIAATGSPTSYSATGLPPGLTLNSTTGVISGAPTTAGVYSVTVTATNASGTSTATTLTITVAAAPAASRIINFSARALSGPGDSTLIMGFVVAGDGKNLLVRGVGPTLASLGIVNFLADPLLTLFGVNGAVTTNDDWGTNSSGQSQATAISAATSQVGAFALPAGSKDSAMLVTVNNGVHTTGLVRPNGAAGVGLVEIYDTDQVAGSRLINVSARMNVTLGEGTLIAGLVIGGNIPKTVLIRGVGPTLATLGVSGTLADPQISVYSGSTLIASDDNWETGTSSTAAQISAASGQVGAFPLPTGSKDAALVITLLPGAYTVQVTGVNSTTGVALVEVYDTQ